VVVIDSSSVFLYFCDSGLLFESGCGMFIVVWVSW